MRELSTDLIELYSNILPLNPFSVVIFLASWTKDKTIISLTKLLADLNATNPELILYKCYLNSPECEDYVIENLSLKSLPTIALFEQSKLVEITNDFYIFKDKFLSYIQNFHVKPEINPIRVLFQSNTMGLYEEPMFLFISGDRSSVGKSTVSLAIIESLVKLGVPPSTIAYIKPVTQCEAVQPITLFCQRFSIQTEVVSPLVFYKGFTRAFLNNEMGSSNNLIHEIKNAIKKVSKGKKLVIIDGVGYPAVGSICGISNSDVCKSINAPVLLIGKPGVGDAVDSFNLNKRLTIIYIYNIFITICFFIIFFIIFYIRFFEFDGNKVIGVIFNKLAKDGFYSLEVIIIIISYNILFLS